MGGIDRASARNHPDKNIITRAIGARDHVEADFFNLELQAEDLVLVDAALFTHIIHIDYIGMHKSGCRLRLNPDGRRDDPLYLKERWQS